MSFVKMQPAEWEKNPFTAIGKDWFLLTAGTMESGFNFMTASWGQMGILWNQPSVTCYVRRSRHTFGFMEQQNTFTLSFFEEEQRKALQFCGAHSGRDCDKAAETGLTPIEIGGGVSFAEAKTILVCRKEFSVDMPADRLPEEIVSRFYNPVDEHRLYIGTILEAYRAE